MCEIAKLETRQSLTPTLKFPLIAASSVISTIYYNSLPIHANSFPGLTQITPFPPTPIQKKAAPILPLTQILLCIHINQ